jgi:hypothetical protein
MSQPTPYTRHFSFTNDQTANPSTKTPGNQLDIEYNAILTTLNQTLSNLALIQRDDGALANGSVGPDQLTSAALVSGVSPATQWATPVNYLTNNTVFFGFKLYRCLISHTSGVFATDLAAGKWLQISDLSYAIGPGLSQTVGGGGSVTLDLGNVTQLGTGAVARTVVGKLREVFSVADFGVLGTANDTPVFQAAVNALNAAGGGTLLVPPGIFAVHGLTLPGNITLRGAGKTATYLQSWSTDATVVALSGGNGGLEYMTVFGKGVNNDTSSFGATQAALTVAGIENVIRSVRVWGGYYALYVTGVDNSFYDVNADLSYGPANVATVGANWYVRCKFDHTPVSVALTNTYPYSAWAATTAYTVGQVRLTGGYAIACTGAGTSGGVAPTLKNYGVNITDGTATWQLVAPATYAGFLIGTGAGENHLTQVDLSGPYSQSLTVNPGGGADASTFMTDGVISAAVVVSSGILCVLTGNELGADISIAGGTRTIIQGNSSVGTPIGITVAPNINNFVISGNHLDGGTINVSAGTSNHYRITDNVNCIVVDSGSGADKVVVTGVTGSGGVMVQSVGPTFTGPVVTTGANNGYTFADRTSGPNWTVYATGGSLRLFNATSDVFTLASTGAVTMTGALTYGGVTLANAVTGTGNMVLSASPTLTGTPAAPTAAVDTNTTQIATTAMVLGQAAAATPLAIGTAAVGTSTRFARADHVHAMTSLTNSVAAPVTMTTKLTYYDGPSVAQGTSGTWLVTGTITVNSAAVSDQILAKLWDGTTLIASSLEQANGAQVVSISLSGIITSPAGNLRISANNVTTNGGTIASSNGIDAKASTITAIRIA